jgi:hypothetical protein
MFINYSSRVVDNSRLVLRKRCLRRRTWRSEVMDARQKFRFDPRLKMGQQVGRANARELFA